MEEHYSKRRKTLENSIIRCKTSMINALLIKGQDKLKTDDFNFSLGKSEKWSINIDLLDNIQKENLIDEGLAENLFKPKISEIKNKFSISNDERPKWIEIEKTDFIKVR